MYTKIVRRGEMRVVSRYMIRRLMKYLVLGETRLDAGRSEVEKDDFLEPRRSSGGMGSPRRRWSLTISARWTCLLWGSGWTEFDVTELERSVQLLLGDGRVEHCEVR